MAEIRRTQIFGEWLRALRDRQARAKIEQRIDRLEEGNPGDSKSVGSGVVEMRINCGPGYRVYYVHHERTIVVLLCGGDKSTQQKDIERAKALANQLLED
jgi:putative addiction module killer protein